MTDPKSVSERRMFCVTGDTLLLGDNTQIQDIKIGQLCLGGDGLNSITNKYQRDYVGDIINVKASGMLPFRVTPEHPILVVDGVFSTTKPREYSFGNPYWVEAGKLISKNKGPEFMGHYLLVPRLKGSISDEYVSVKKFANRVSDMASDKIKLTPDFAWLLGMYVAEGFGIHPMFALNKNETLFQDRLISIINSLGYKARKYERTTTTTVEWSSRAMGRALTEWCGKGAHNKMIPEFILLHTDEQLLKSFLAGYMEGDGYENKLVSDAGTVSKLLALQLQLLEARLGMMAHVYTYVSSNSVINGRRIKSGKIYRVITRKINSEHRRSVKVTEKYIYTPIRQLESEPYSGKVFNVDTSDNTYLVSNTITHNCINFDCSFVTDDERTSIDHQQSHALCDPQIFCYHEPRCATLYDHRVKSGDPTPWQKSF